MRHEIALNSAPWLCTDVSRLEQFNPESQSRLDLGDRIERNLGMDLQKLREEEDNGIDLPPFSN
jgi:hypothetical protein